MGYDRSQLSIEEHANASKIALVSYQDKAKKDSPKGCDRRTNFQGKNTADQDHVQSTATRSNLSLEESEDR